MPRMTKVLKVSIVPAIVGLSALFLALPQTGATATVEMVTATGGFRFASADIHAGTGARIAFENRTAVTHTATCGGCAWDTADVQPGQTVTLAFPEDGAFSYGCRYHGSQGMVGRLTIGSGSAPAAPGGTSTS